MRYVFVWATARIVPGFAQHTSWSGHYIYTQQHFARRDTQAVLVVTPAGLPTHHHISVWTMQPNQCQGCELTSSTISYQVYPRGVRKIKRFTTRVWVDSNTYNLKHYVNPLLYQFYAL